MVSGSAVRLLHRAAGTPLVRHGSEHWYRAVMADSVEWFVADHARELTGALAFVECTAEVALEVQTVPTAVGDVAGREA
jgi:hypothetical protein